MAAKTSQRGKGEGAIYQDTKGLWTAVVELPMTEGKRRRKVIRSKDKNTVIRKLTEMKSQLQERGDLPTESQTVEQWSTYWLENILVKEVRPNTMDNYRTVFRKHINPVIGNVRLDKLTPAHIRRVTDRLQEKFSSTYALNAHRVMSSCFTTAEREGRIGRNPAKLTKAPRKARAQLDVLTTDEASTLIRQFGETPEAFMWAAFILTGARRGELLGLEWDRVTDEIELSWQLQRFPIGELNVPNDYEYRHLTGGLYLTRPKSSAGWRVIPLVDPLKSILERWRELSPPNEYGLVFASQNGTPLGPDNVSRDWAKVLKKSGIEKTVRLHDLRHTTVDLLYEAGVPESIIMEIVGHSTRSVTRGYKSRGNRPQLTLAMQSLSELISIEK
jgi:integrase